MATKNTKKPATKITAARRTKERAVVVTTQGNGIFIGRSASKIGDKTAVLRDARNVFYYTAQTKGFIGIAVNGLFAGAKVGPPAPQLELANVTSIVEAKAEAVETWAKVGWS